MSSSPVLGKRSVDFNAIFAHRKRHRHEQYLAPAVVVSEFIEDMPLVRAAKLLRRRWDEAYLVNLATNEGSFLLEHRLHLP